MRKAAGLSVSEAARLTSTRLPKGISTARWSQIENGYEVRSGGTVRPVGADAGMLAHMARTVGATPARLEEEGARPDAAEVLREIQRQDESPAPPLAVIHPAPDLSWRPPARDDGMNSPERIAAAAPLADTIRDRLEELQEQGITDPDGRQVFPADDWMAGAWDIGRQSWPPHVNRWVLALAEQRRADPGGQPQQQGRRSG